MNAYRCKIQSLSDVDDKGKAHWRMIRQDGREFVIGMEDSELAYLEARIAAVRAKAKDKR